MSFDSDTFTGGTPLDELSVYNAAWSQPSPFSGGLGQIGGDGAWAIGRSTGTYAVYRRSGSPASADYSVFADVTAITSGWDFQAGVIGRADASGSFYFTLQVNVSSSFRLYKSVSAAFTQLGAYSNTPGTSTQQHEVRMTGTTIEAYLDGVQRVNVTDSDISAAGKAGIVMYDMREAGVADRAKLDNWSGVDLAAAGNPWHYYAQQRAA